MFAMQLPSMHQYTRPQHTSPVAAARRPLPPVRRQLVAASVSSYDPEVLPPPPPPPPPPPYPPPRQVGRRTALLSAAAAGGGVLMGYLLGSQPEAVPGLDATERKEIDELRAEAKFRRDYDGHVFAQARDGTWFEIRLDAQLPGTVLLRSEKDGCIYFFTLNITQVDLTDDYVVISLFGDGAWETTIQKLVGKDAGGFPTDVYLDQAAFRDLLSIVSPTA